MTNNSSNHDSTTSSISDSIDEKVHIRNKYMFAWTRACKVELMHYSQLPQYIHKKKVLWTAIKANERYSNITPKQLSNRYYSMMKNENFMKEYSEMSPTQISQFIQQAQIERNLVHDEKDNQSTTTPTSSSSANNNIINEIVIGSKPIETTSNKRTVDSQSPEQQLRKKTSSTSKKKSNKKSKSLEKKQSKKRKIYRASTTIHEDDEWSDELEFRPERYSQHSYMIHVNMHKGKKRRKLDSISTTTTTTSSTEPVNKSNPPIQLIDLNVCDYDDDDEVPPDEVKRLWFGQIPTTNDIN
jgi:hypothetical protein